jgi:dienelactone hydrolase
MTLSPIRTTLNRIYKRRLDAWEQELVVRTTNRVVRPFEWGMDWISDWPCAAQVPVNGHDPVTYLRLINQAAAANSEEFFGYKRPTNFRLKRDRLLFTSAIASPYAENNTVHGQWFPARTKTKSAVIVLPHWNAQAHQHVSLCKALQFLGVSALRVSLPYHDYRMPAELDRADYAVSSNVARTIDAARQGVIDTRSCVDWLETQGYRDFGIVGTSLGSCYAFLSSAHDSRLRVNVFNLFSLYFADAVWTGRTTHHIRQGLDGHVDLDSLRDAWMAITPLSYMKEFARFEKKSLFIHASYDTTFLPKYSTAMLEEIRLRDLEHKSVVLPCGHHTAGKSPYIYMDAYHIISFLKQNL